MEGKACQSKATDKSAMPARFFSISVITEGVLLKIERQRESEMETKG